MKQIITKGIVLTRTNYQEADRIMTLLTPDQGKVSVLAKGVRKGKSKMAGGVELFSISEISYITGRGELSTLTSARLIKHFDTIVKDINRTMLGYEVIKLVHKTTEDEPGHEYFDLLHDALDALDQEHINSDLIKLWFTAQLLKLAGHTPNLHSDTKGSSLEQGTTYLFSHDDMAFLPRDQAPYGQDHIKYLRLAFSDTKPRALQKVQSTTDLLAPCLSLLQTILPNHIRT